jgi:TrmH family RNA methyltransferase
MRKTARILQGLEVELAGGRLPDRAYLLGIASLSFPRAGQGAAEAAQSLERAVTSSADPIALRRATSALRHELLRALSAEPAEWDFVSTETGALDRSATRVLPLTVYLEDLRAPFNVGSIFRTAEAFGAERILLSPRTPLPTHPRAEKTSMGAGRALPWEVAALSSLRGSNGVFGLELGGAPISEFAFPRRGTVLVGSEELGLSPEALALADAGLGRVSIPLAGAKRSINVSVAFGILMQAWVASVSREQPKPPPRT